MKLLFIIHSLEFGGTERQLVELIKGLKRRLYDVHLICLDNAPEFLIIAKVNAKTAMQRITERNKKDNCEFEKLNFQKLLQEKYEGEHLRKLFEVKGTKVFYIDTNQPASVDDTRLNARLFFNEYFKNRMQAMNNP